MFESVRPAISTGRLFGGVSLESYLLTRHRAIDALLTRAIEERGVTQVIEVACGLSPRGWRFSERFGDRLTYVETDLPAMAARKREALTRMGSLSRHHRVEDVDALRDDGSESLAAVARELDPGAGLAIITEGLLGYLPWDAVADMWRRFATVLGGFHTGIYISELHMRRDPVGASAGVPDRPGGVRPGRRLSALRSTRSGRSGAARGGVRGGSPGAGNQDRASRAGTRQRPGPYT